MIFRIGIENNFEGRSIAWALEHPGCFAYGVNSEAALSNIPTALDKYAGWILQHEPRTWLSFLPEDVKLVVDGTWNVYFVNDDLDQVSETEGYSVNAFFPYDWKPLTAIEIERGLKMLEWSRADLLKTISGLSEEKRDATYPGERWSINGVLAHVGSAEWWYMDRLGLAFPRAELPEDPLQRIEKVRKHFNSILFRLKDLSKVIGIDGEFWSPRKLLRRALWHERDHIQHIQKLIAMG